MRRTIRRYWRDFLSIYYANTRTWRWLKSAALVFLGFFCWTTAGVLLSVRPEWTFLTYVAAYGFLLLIWGPLTHFVILPLVIRLRRGAQNSTLRFILRNSSKINLTIFFAFVIVLGAVAPGFLLLDFAPVFPDDGTTVSGSLECDVGEEVVTCEIVDPEGFDHVVVTSGGSVLVTVHEPPYNFTIDRDDIAETRIGQQFEVELRGEDGELLLRRIELI